MVTGGTRHSVGIHEFLLYYLLRCTRHYYNIIIVYNTRIAPTDCVSSYVFSKMTVCNDEIIWPRRYISLL